MDETAPLGLRERNKERKHVRIRAVALEVFGRQGFDATTVDEIAEAAEVSRSTLFRYFPTKEDLVLLDDAVRLDALQTAFVDRPADEPVVDSLRVALVALARAYEDDRVDLGERYRIIRATPALMARTLEQQSGREDALAAAIEARTGDELQARLLAATGMAVVRVSLKTWLAAGPSADLGVLVADALAKLADDLHPRPAVRRR